MKILLIDCSLKNSIVSLKINENIYKYVGDISLSSSLIPLYLKRIFKDANIEMSDLDFIILPSGGGSYTGLRIAYSNAFGISSAFKIKLVQIKPLDCFGFKYRNIERNIVPVIDIKRDTIWSGLYYKGVSLHDSFILENNQFKVKIKSFENPIICGFDANLISGYDTILDNDITNEYFELGLIDYKNHKFGSGNIDYLREVFD